MDRRAGVTAIFLLALQCVACDKKPKEVVPPAWQDLVKVEGQAYPVPASWISTPEGRIAHGLKLPSVVPIPVPFDFSIYEGRHFWEKKENIRKEYFRHLCRTESGTWVIRSISNVKGIYFSRPKGGSEIRDNYLLDPYAPEAPAIERHLHLTADELKDQGALFVAPPFFNYEFVEQPRRNVAWQQEVSDPYIRMFGYRRAKFAKKGHVVVSWNDLTPMQLEGIPEPTAKYAYTWRGITRPRDREFNIAGIELIAYDRESNEVVAVHRTFSVAMGLKNESGHHAIWLRSSTCSSSDYASFENLMFNKFPIAVLSPFNNKDLNK